MDIHAHGKNVETVIRELRTWLATESQRKRLPGGRDIFERYERFLADFPALCGEARLQPAEATFVELRLMISEWLKQNR